MKEKEVWAISGFYGFLASLLLLVGGTYLFTTTAIAGIMGGIFCYLLGFILSTGLLVVEPNTSRSVVFLGRYLGTLRRSGWWFTAPLTSRPAVSLRVRNFQGDKLKVNDHRGNPIEIAAVVVWRVVDVAQALFEVEQYQEFVKIQSETAVRHIASQYPYDSFEGITGTSLRENTDEVSEALKKDLQERLKVAGVEVLDARLTHLAYAPEIAPAMLQRQQAEAVVAARAKIVEGAAGMVEDALEKLEKAGVLDLDPERRAAMINNLLVAIVGERGVQPVINTGSIY